MQEKKSLANYEDLGKYNRPSDRISFISNELNSLVESFFHTFKNSLNSGCLRHIVVFPTNVIKNRLIQHLKQETGAFFGIRFLSLPQAIEHVMKLSVDGPLIFPHHHHLMIYLFEQIENLVSKHPGTYPDLTNYIQNDETKILCLAEQLSHTFMAYGLYGSSALKDWLHIDQWQQFLFKKAATHWNFPHTFLAASTTLSIETHFHLFALPNIPNIYQNLFDRTFATVYHRSPTPHYVSDILPDRALAKIDEKLKQEKIAPSERLAFHQLGKEPNRFFANLASSRSNMIDWLYEKEVSEEFISPEGESALKQHQRAIFALENSQPQTTSEDVTIQIHAASSKFREIEVMYDALSEAFLHNPTLCTHDVQIFAPTIEIYAPAIEYVFGQKESPFGYLISDVCQNSRLSFSGIVRSFFHLALGRFKPKEIFELITSPWIQNPQNCDVDQIKAFWKIFEKIHLHWGFDKQMRQEILEYDNATEKGTFKDAFEKLISSLGYLSSPIEISQAEAFGELIAYLMRIAKDMRHLKNGRFTIGQWIETIFSMSFDYLTECDQKESFLKEISKLTPLDQIVEETIPYDMILNVIDEITSAKEERIVDAEKPILVFSSIDEGSLAAPKITVLLGMDEEAYPRCEQMRSLDQIRFKEGAEKRTTKAEKDKYFFFEALAYTKSRLIITYTQISDRDGKELFPSLLVEDLLSVTEGLSVQKHPPLKAIQIPKHASLHNIKSAPKESFDAIEISNLTRLAVHPLRFFLQKRCGVYLEKEDEEELKEMREFMLSYQGKAEIRQKAYMSDEQDVIKHIDTHGLMPTALFSIAAKIEVENEIKEARENLQALGLTEDDFITILFDPAIKEPIIRDEQEYLYPPIQIDKTMLYGRLDMVTKEGLFSFGPKSVASIWKAWPKFLIMSLIKDTPFKQSILFAKDGERIDLPVENPLQSLKTFLQYYELAYDNPSPLLPDHIKTYAKNQSPPKSSGMFKDAYLESIQPNLSIDWMPFIEPKILEAL